MGQRSTLLVIFEVAAAVRPNHPQFANHFDSVYVRVATRLWVFVVHNPPLSPSHHQHTQFSTQANPASHHTCWSSSCFIREFIIAWMSGGATGAATAGTGGSGGGGRGAATAGAATGACETCGGRYGTAVETAGGWDTGSGGAPGNGG